MAPAALEPPPHPTLWACLAFGLCTLVLAYPALGGGFLVNPHSDQYIGGYPARYFAAMRAKHGSCLAARMFVPMAWASMPASPPDTH